MRFAFIGKSHLFSRLPLLELCAGHQLVAVVECAERGTDDAKQRRRSRWQRFLRGGSWLLRTAKTRHAPYMLMRRDNRRHLHRFLKAARPDVICVASLTFLLKRDVLTLPQHGAINLHPSLLPRYHGPFPWFWQYHDGLDTFGITVHRLDEGQDTGPILAQASVPIGLGTTMHDAQMQVTTIGAQLMRQVVDQLAKGGIREIAHDPGAWPKARIVTRDERFIDWDDWSLDRIWHMLRGTSGWVDHLGPILGAHPCHDLVPVKQWRGPPLDPPGVARRRGADWIISHREGGILVARRLNPRKAVRALLNPAVHLLRSIRR